MSIVLDGSTGISSIGTLTGVTSISSASASTPTVMNDSGGTQIGTLCRAWVNFNGTGTVAIRASFNVSSITDNGTGDYTINFTTAMPDANYSYQGVCSTPSVVNGILIVSTRTYTASAFPVIAYSLGTGSLFDPSIFVASVFR